MFPKPLRVWALLCLILALQLATAQSLQLIPRADAATPTTSGAPPATTASPTETANKAEGNKDVTSKTAPSDASASITPTVATSPNSTLSGASTATIPAPTPSGSPTFLNATIPHGQLPLAPEITPGWGVAGVIMMLTGLVYALIGIKNPWIHAFFSTAYMAALGVAVLIIYVMNVPLSDALQGGYVAAIILTGCAIGTLSMFFKELTEGLGCALGGFCISMWLLCLVPGGLLHVTAAKAIFIACFTLGGFAFYFSRYTRDWSLMICIAFAGATITVLGIDCFSRAGLKEFWAWIWALNDTLFPLGADTYPVTRGIRVETAAIIIVFLIGTMSQVKLWKIVREKREKRAAVRAEGQRNLREEEEIVGRDIEESNARDRAEWERIYGDGGTESITASQLSENVHIQEKNPAHSQVYAARKRSDPDTEMDDLSECGQRGMDQLMTGEGGVTVRVGADDFPGSVRSEAGDGDDELAIDEKGDRGFNIPQPSNSTERRASKFPAKSKRASANTAAGGKAPVDITPSPAVVPLPFSVPQDNLARSERSSVATFADAEDDIASATPNRVERHSVVKRLSRGSAELLRSMSQRSGRSTHTPDFPRDGGESTEMLLTRMNPHRQDKDNDSLAATMDLESVSGGERRSMDMVDGVYPEVEATAVDEIEGDGALRNTNTAEVEQSMATSKQPKRQSEISQNKQSSLRSEVVTGPTETETSDQLLNAPQSEMPKSVASETSGPVSLTKDHLPSSLSRVALSYRTNEWAKHLSNAELPDMDELRVEMPARTTKANDERAKPVNIHELRRTAEDGVPAPALPRSLSRLSTMSAASARPQVARLAETEPLQVAIPPAAAVSLDMSGPVSPKDAIAASRLHSSSSSNIRKLSATVKPILEEERSLRFASGTLPVAQEEEAPLTRDTSPDLDTRDFVKPAAAPPGIVSFGSPQTLLGQREMFLRTRSQGNLLGNIGEMQTSLTPPMTAPSDASSLHNYPMYAAAFGSDPDEIPLSQRRSMILGSRLSTNDSSYSLNRSASRAGSSHGGADNLTFNSHQPKRNSSVPAQAVRDAQLANFRMSVSQELRAGNPMKTSGGRETPFASTNSLLGGREAEVQRNIEMQRHVLMGQKEAEGQRREMQRRDREFSDRAFDDRMRSGDLIDAHREALRKMQRSASKY
ncbi:hypothetical protein CCM_01498 [Cordyceps militaris CM01]|uniref:TM7S3/TM198-like domain-containing protein n=1 Tax=Cordyceps militaris (strain CM01) TaxID=983644 RepID=G3J5D0_CORMM|nr:uncharacterized protein CCM_01498 [Cordyceps militaris CM01]EGX96840.1 hypothetical protein CCM_01498 [Cordyceps militaris CM01]